MRVADEAAVDDGDPLVGRYAGQGGRGVCGSAGRADLEAERPQLVGER
ncbi:hypothetical protein OHA81_26220 [Streptomyces sp. NBC_00667]|nr:MULTISPECIES: hypothetical protein [unclassified Streptomyces]WUC63799.1 hypothetical protein OG861_05905 [Streptomyces sp. NBC_00539]